MDPIVCHLTPSFQHFLCDDLKPSQHYTLDSVSLNMVKKYTHHLPPTIRELVQNWRDRCWTLAAEIRPEQNFPEPNVRCERISNFEKTGMNLIYYEATIGGSLLGWIIESTSVPHCLYLFNEDTELSPDILRFGHSDKTNLPYLAGSFGDGLKPEVNRLMRSGATVNIFTGRSQWQFLYDENETLMCNIRTVHGEKSMAETLEKGTLFTITNLPRECVIDSKDFLFLNPCKEQSLSFSSKQFVIRVLFNPEHISSIYLHGIFVQQEHYPRMPFGVDYHGVLTPEMGVSRDRNDIREDFIHGRLLFAAGKLHGSRDQGNTELLDKFARLYYNYLRSRYFSMHCLITSKFSKQVQQQVGDFLYHGLTLSVVKRKGKRDIDNEGANGPIIPLHRDEIQLYQEELRLFNFIFEEVPLELLRAIRQSPKCPIWEELRTQFSNYFVCLDELLVTGDLPYTIEINEQINIVEWETKEHHQLAQRVCELAVEMVDNPNLLKLKTIRFKKFDGEKSSHTVFPVKFGNQRFIIIDIKKMNSSFVHKQFKRSDATFLCGENCSCTQVYFFNEIVSTVEKMHKVQLRDRVFLKLQRKMMSGLAPQIVSNPEEEELEHPKNTDEPMKQDTSNDEDLIGEKQNKFHGGNGGIHPTQSSLEGHALNGVEPVVSDQVDTTATAEPFPFFFGQNTSTEPSTKANSKGFKSAKQAPKSKSTMPNDNPRDEPNIHDYVNNIRETVTGCLDSYSVHKKRQIPKGISKAGSPPTITQTVTDGETPIELKMDEKVSAQMTVPVYYSPRYLQFLPKYVDDISNLVKTIRLLRHSVFDNTNIQFCVFYDESTVVAFNMNGLLFFNVFC
ncbi:hypothetical protein P9112_013989 [Eukaryota sp. TZLM1-RC]